MKNRKIQKIFLDNGFGFPIQILDAPMRKVRGEWCLDLNLVKYEKAVLVALALKSTRLTGNEIKFVRHHFKMNLKSFGKRFGDVAHSAVIKWEKNGDNSTNMNWACEKDIRLFVINTVNPSYLRKLYTGLEKVALSKPKKLKLEAYEIMAA